MPRCNRHCGTSAHFAARLPSINNEPCRMFFFVVPSRAAAPGEDGKGGGG
jgi:hypothetical protein